MFGAQDDGAVLVCWRASVPNGSPVTGYTVEASPGGGAATVPADRSSCFLDGLSNGTEYLFSVTPHSAVGDGPTATSPFGTTPAPDDEDDPLTWSEENDLPGVRQRIRSLVGPERWGIHLTDERAHHLTLRVKDLGPEERDGLVEALGLAAEFVLIEPTTVSLLELDQVREMVRHVLQAMPPSNAFVSSSEDPRSQTILVTTSGGDGSLEATLRAAIPDALLTFRCEPPGRTIHVENLREVDDQPSTGRQPS